MKTIEEALELAEESLKRSESYNPGNMYLDQYRFRANFWLEYARTLAISQKNGVDRDNDLR